MAKISRAVGDTYAADAEAGRADQAKREPNPNSTLRRDDQGVVEPGAPAGAASAVLRSVAGKVGTPGEPAQPEAVERDDETTLEKEKARSAHSKGATGGSPSRDEAAASGGDVERDSQGRAGGELRAAAQPAESGDDKNQTGKGPDTKPARSSSTGSGR